MTLSLTKGQKVDLTKTNPGLVKLNIAGGWDPNPTAGQEDYDLDIFAFALGADKKVIMPKVTYFGKKDGILGLQLDKDNLDGEGDGDDETIFVDLSKIETDVESIVFAVNIYNATSRGNQNFGRVQNAFVRAYRPENKEELIRYDLSEDYGTNTGVLLGKLYRHNGEWKFEAIGTGVNGDINQIIQAYNA